MCTCRYRCFLDWRIAFRESSSVIDKRIKRCEDQVLTGIILDSEKLTSGQLIWRVCGIMFFIGYGCLLSSFFLFAFVLPPSLMVPGLFLALIVILLLGAETSGVVLSVAAIVIGAVTGATSWYLYILPVACLLLLVLPLLIIRQLRKKNLSRLEKETETYVIPALSQIMTVEKFDCSDHVPYDDDKSKNIEGNFYIVGRRHGREIRFSNLSFTKTVTKKSKQVISKGLINIDESFCGICVTYLADGKVTDRMLDIIRYNLQPYGLYDAFASTSNKVTVLLNRGYYFIKNPKIFSVSHSDQLRIDAAKLDSVYQAIQEGLLQKQMPSRLRHDSN